MTRFPISGLIPLLLLTLIFCFASAASAQDPGGTGGGPVPDCDEVTWLQDNYQIDYRECVPPGPGLCPGGGEQVNVRIRFTVQCNQSPTCSIEALAQFLAFLQGMLEHYDATLIYEWPGHPVIIKPEFSDTLTLEWKGTICREKSVPRPGEPDGLVVPLTPWGF